MTQLRNVAACFYENKIIFGSNFGWSLILFKKNFKAQLCTKS